MMITEKSIRYFPVLLILSLIFLGSSDEENWIYICYATIVLSIVLKGYAVTRTKKVIAFNWPIIFYGLIGVISCAWIVIDYSHYWSCINFLILLEALHKIFLEMPNKEIRPPTE